MQFEPRQAKNEMLLARAGVAPNLEPEDLEGLPGGGGTKVRLAGLEVSECTEVVVGCGAMRKHTDM